MKLKVTLKPNARHERIEKVGDGDYHISVKEPALEGKANDALTRLLAKHFSVPRSSVLIKLGAHSRNKIVVIDSLD
jgi:uncharacterized protein YggU (UPF0235/DUF167 family)